MFSVTQAIHPSVDVRAVWRPCAQVAGCVKPGWHGAADCCLRVCPSGTRPCQCGLNAARLNCGGALLRAHSTSLMPALPERELPSEPHVWTPELRRDPDAPFDRFGHALLREIRDRRPPRDRLRLGLALFFAIALQIALIVLLRLEMRPRYVAPADERENAIQVTFFAPPSLPSAAPTVPQIAPPPPLAAPRRVHAEPRRP